MKRRIFPVTALALTLAAGLSATSAFAQTKWDLAAAYPATNFHTENMVQLAGVPLDEAIPMASLAPARMLGMEHRLGSLAVGKRANLLALTPALYQQHIWVAGREITPARTPASFSEPDATQGAKESSCI